MRGRMGLARFGFGLFRCLVVAGSTLVLARCGGRSTQTLEPPADASSDQSHAASGAGPDATGVGGAADASSSGGTHSVDASADAAEPFDAAPAGGSGGSAGGNAGEDANAPLDANSDAPEQDAAEDAGLPDADPADASSDATFDGSAGGNGGAGGSDASAPPAGGQGGSGATDAGSDSAIPDDCGDLVVDDGEACDDGNDAAGDGCASDCSRVEFGYTCPASGGACSPLPAGVCGNLVREGGEECDDGNRVNGDGCSASCEREPVCTSAGCLTVCGDGVFVPGGSEACDDGNLVDGDGCSSVCTVEVGYACSEPVLPTVSIPVVFRDFIAMAKNGSVKHPDFQSFYGADVSPGLVEDTLGSDGRPVYTGLCSAGWPCSSQQMTTQENFDQWYRDVPGINVRKDTEVVLTRQQNGAYTYPAVSGQQLFPLDNQGFVAQNLESSLYGHNFGFTSELHTWFLFQGGETLMFAGDDDVWIFVNGRLALDIGGLHPLVTRTIVLDAATGAANCYTGSTTTTPCSVPSIELGIQPGRLYQLSLFHAERAASDSNFTLTLMGFVGTPTVCSKL